MSNQRKTIKSSSAVAIAIVAMALCLVASGVLVADSQKEKLTVANELATLFRSARAVISQNQKLINDANMGNKGLTGEVVIRKAKENYAKSSGHKFVQSDPSTRLGRVEEALFSAVSSVMDQAQPLINEKGKGFKGFLPAIFAKQVADAFSSNMDNKISIKLTAPKEYVRNRANRPDKWEHSVIENKFKSPNWEKGKWFAENASIRGNPAFRFILPEYYGESCLKCHGSPKGERDITGGKKEGGKLNELGGAISIAFTDE